jgi:membrane protein DedA with SNARE-associated domain
MGDWISQLIGQFGYAGIAFLMFAETMFPPIPSEVIMPLAGLSAARGGLSLGPVILAGTFGAMLGNFLWYWIAIKLGLARFRPLVDRFGRWMTLDWDEVERSERWFAKYGVAFVFFSRMLPTLRSIASIPAGLMNMRLIPFLIWSTIGTAAWTAALASAGYVLGSRYTEVDAYIGPVSTAIIVAILLGYAWRVVTWKPKR